MQFCDWCGNRTSSAIELCRVGGNPYYRGAVFVLCSERCVNRSIASLTRPAFRAAW